MQGTLAQVQGAAVFHSSVGTLGYLEGRDAAFSGHVSAAVVTQSSDARLKQNIARLGASALDAVMQLKMYTYSLRSDAEHTVRTGFLAQQVLQPWSPARMA